MPHKLSQRFGAYLIAAGIAAAAPSAARAGTAPVAVAPQYDTSHVYVAPADVDRFVSSFLATFGGKSSRQVVVNVSPVASSTSSQLLQTPVGTVSLFGYRTPVPYPFGLERTGYLVTNLDVAVSAARACGAAVVVAPFPDPIGRDAIIQWPGGVDMQLYWHTKTPSYASFKFVPENRVYVSPDHLKAFLGSFLAFSHGNVVSDVGDAPGVEIGEPGKSYRRVRIESNFGRMEVLVTDGHLPYPYGWETTGYQVDNVEDTLSRATEAGVSVLVPPFVAGGRQSAMVEFPGGYIAEIHSQVTREAAHSDAAPNVAPPHTSGA
jgi:predicted enzyme related to lactoylglutathione lyase